jgi:hypothetical protein
MTTTTPAKQQAARQPARLRPEGHSTQARKLATAILEVLAGLRTPSDAAAAIELSLPRYYACEARALHGLLAACEPPPRGRLPSAAGEVAALKRRCTQLEQQLVRQQTLLRLAQRSLGLSPPAPQPGKPTKGKRRRRPRLRVLQAIAQVRPQPAGVAGGTDAASSG